MRLLDVLAGVVIGVIVTAALVSGQTKLEHAPIGVSVPPSSLRVLAKCDGVDEALVLLRTILRRVGPADSIRLEPNRK